jgi:hypothetical protein
VPVSEAENIPADAEKCVHGRIWRQFWRLFGGRFPAKPFGASFSAARQISNPIPRNMLIRVGSAHRTKQLRLRHAVPPIFHPLPPADGSPILGFAGLWDTYRDPETGEEQASATMIVC